MVDNFVSCFRFLRLIEDKTLFLNCYFLQVLLYEKGEDMWMFRSVLSYVVELAKCDLNYDIRDRAYILKELMSCYLDNDMEEKTNSLPQKDIPQILAECIFRGQRKPMSPEPINFRFYLPGSLSQIVLHAAPGYEPLPKPGSLLCNDLHQHLNVVQRREGSGEGATNSDSYGTDDPDTLSQSANESTSGYSSENSISGSSASDEPGSESEDDNNADPLIQLSEVGISNKKKKEVSQSSSDSMMELMSKGTLESWLDGQPSLSDPNLSKQNQARRYSATISVGDIGGRVKPKIYDLLDPINGNGLRVNYSFSSEISSMSPQFVCVELTFENCSAESMSNILLVDEESNKGLDSADQSLDSDER